MPKVYILAKDITLVNKFAKQRGLKFKSDYIHVIRFDTLCGTNGEGCTLYILKDFASVPNYCQILRYAQTKGFKQEFIND